MVHPYMDGNKRTARLFANVLLNGRLGYFYDWNYKNLNKREKYQQKFARGSLTGEFSLILNIHKNERMSDGKSNNKDTKETLDTLWTYFVARMV